MTAKTPQFLIDCIFISWPPNRESSSQQEKEQCRISVVFMGGAKEDEEEDWKEKERLAVKTKKAGGEEKECKIQSEGESSYYRKLANFILF